MSTNHIQLLTSPDDPEKGVYGSRAWIAPKQHGKIELPVRSGKGMALFSILSWECVTAGEIRWVADAYIKDLEAVKKQASRFFRGEQKKKLRSAGRKKG